MGRNESWADASVFFGDNCLAWSLARAAEVHKLIGPTVMSLDFIAERISNGTLQTQGGDSLARFPFELYGAVKDQLFPAALEECTREWMHPDAEEHDDEDDEADDIYGREVLWRLGEWGGLETFRPLLSTLRIYLHDEVSIRLGRDLSNVDEDDSCPVNELCVPIIGQYAHKERRGMTELSSLPGQIASTDTCKLDFKMDFEEQRRIVEAFNTLYKKYGVEFTDEGAWRKPDVSWRLWVGAYANY